jgi:hypothetical protein
MKSDDLDAHAHSLCMVMLVVQVPVLQGQIYSADRDCRQIFCWEVHTALFMTTGSIEKFLLLCAKGLDR